MARVEVAKSAGFCFGVSRAVKLAEDAAENGGKIATLGPIIHNDCAVERLAQKGVRIINSPDEAMPDETVVIRSHGIDEQTERRIIKNGNRYIDATCPFVKKIHRLVNNAYKENKEIIIIGDHKRVVRRQCTRCSELRRSRKYYNKWRKKRNCGISNHV